MTRDDIRALAALHPPCPPLTSEQIALYRALRREEGSA